MMRCRSGNLALMRRDGRDMGSILRKTGSLFQYFSPSHSRRVATLAEVTGSVSKASNASGGGGCGPARVTEEMKPARCSANTIYRLYLVFGIDVRPRRAREAFCRCEHVFTMPRIPIVKERGRKRCRAGSEVRIGGSRPRQAAS